MTVFISNLGYLIQFYSYLYLLCKYHPFCPIQYTPASNMKKEERKFQRRKEFSLVGAARQIDTTLQTAPKVNGIYLILKNEKNEKEASTNWSMVYNSVYHGEFLDINELALNSSHQIYRIHSRLLENIAGCVCARIQVKKWEIAENIIFH